MAYDGLTSTWTMTVASDSIGNDAWSSLVNFPPIDCLRGSRGSLCVMGTIVRRDRPWRWPRDRRAMAAPKAETISIWPKLKVRPPRATSGLPICYTLDSRWHFCCQCAISNPWPVLDSSSKTTRGMLFGFFVKPQNGFVWHVAVFWEKVFSRVF